METFKFENYKIILNKQGKNRYSKLTYPVRYGCYSEIETEAYLFQFNLNGEIKYIKGRHHLWPDRNEWLKRTMTNDWVYYASGGAYNRIYSLLGEYYYPCFSYPTNTIFHYAPDLGSLLPSALAALSAVQEELRRKRPSVSDPDFKAFFKKVIDHDKDRLLLRKERFYALIGGPISVLPPDTRHVDYNVIPVILADGCLYNCGFCQVKSGENYHTRSTEQILSQIKGLSSLYGHDLANYNAVFLGQHDALNAGKEAIEFAARKAYEGFRLAQSMLLGRYLFLFGSVDSIILSGEALFSMMNRLPYYTYINIGLESFDQDTLKALKKPIDAEAVGEAFKKMQWINKKFDNIEITANLVLGSSLPAGHQAAIIEQTSEKLERHYPKGALYLSPLSPLSGLSEKGEIQKIFFNIKNLSRLPTYLYLIQRL